MLKLSTRSRSAIQLCFGTCHYYNSARVCPCFLDAWLSGCPCFRHFAFLRFSCNGRLRNLTRERHCKHVRMRWVGRGSTDLRLPHRRRQCARFYGSQKGVNLFQRQRVPTFRAHKVVALRRHLIPCTSEQARMRDRR